MKTLHPSPPSVCVPLLMQPPHNTQHTNTHTVSHTTLSVAHTHLCHARPCRPAQIRMEQHNRRQQFENWYNQIKGQVGLAGGGEGEGERSGEGKFMLATSVCCSMYLPVMLWSHHAPACVSCKTAMTHVTWAMPYWDMQVASAAPVQPLLPRLPHPHPH